MLSFEYVNVFHKPSWDHSLRYTYKFFISWPSTTNLPALPVSTSNLRLWRYPPKKWESALRTRISDDYKTLQLDRAGHFAYCDEHLFETIMWHDNGIKTQCAMLLLNISGYPPKNTTGADGRHSRRWRERSSQWLKVEIDMDVIWSSVGRGFR